MPSTSKSKYGTNDSPKVRTTEYRYDVTVCGTANVTITSIPVEGKSRENQRCSLVFVRAMEKIERFARLRAPQKTDNFVAGNNCDCSAI